MIEEVSLISKKKKGLRQEMLALRRALSSEKAVCMEKALFSNVISLPEYDKAKRIMAFLSMKGEAGLDAFIEYALSQGKEIYIPVCLPGRRMEAGRLFDMEHFDKGPLGLRNLLPGYQAVRPKDLDLVLVPALACGMDGTRLGMGAGYYDRYLPNIPYEKRIAVLWDFQVFSSVPSEKYDEKISKIVTESRIIDSKRG